MMNPAFGILVKLVSDERVDYILKQVEYLATAGTG